MNLWWISTNHRPKICQTWDEDSINQSDRNDRVPNPNPRSSESLLGGWFNLSKTALVVFSFRATSRWNSFRVIAALAHIRIHCNTAKKIKSISIRPTLVYVTKICLEQKTTQKLFKFLFFSKKNVITWAWVVFSEILGSLATHPFRNAWRRLRRWNLQPSKRNRLILHSRNSRVAKKKTETNILTSWWFQPIWKILVKLDHFPK